MKEVLKALGPVKGRIRRNRFLRGAAAGLAAGFAAAAALQAVAFFVPVQDRGLWAAAAIGAAVILTAAGNALRPVKNREAAEAADACGLQERAVTALEFAGEDEPIRVLQRKDAVRALEGLDARKIRAGSVKKALIAALGGAVLTGCLLLAPNGQDTEAAARKALARTLSEGREAIARAAEEDEGTLDEKGKSELRKITAELNRELGESRDAADALVALDRAEQRLEQMRQQTAGDAAAAADSAAAGNAGQGGEIGNAGETGTETSGDAAAETAEGQQTAAEGEKGAAAGQQSAAAIQSGSAAGQQSGEAALQSAAAGQMKTAQAMSALRSAVNPSQGMNLSGAGMAGALGSQSGQSGSGNTGAGGQPGGKQAGGGAGEGSTNEEQAGGNSGNGGHAAGTREGRLKEAEYETIYDPEHIDKDREDLATEQKRLSDEGSVQAETGPGKGSLGGDVPWGEALGDYAETEARAADRENLTERARKWVAEYFLLLTQQK